MYMSGMSTGFDRMCSLVAIYLVQ